MSEIILYTTSWCIDCYRARKLLKDRGIPFQEVNIDESPDAEDLVLRVNDGRRKVPTVQIGERYFACSPFNSQRFAEELQLPPQP